MKIGDIVEYAGYSWYVIKAGKKNVTLLAKDDKFGEHTFDKHYNEYETSEIRAYLNTTVLRLLNNANGNPLPTKCSDIGITDKVWLLSVNEAKKLPLHVKKFGHFKWFWWLRSPGDFSIDRAADVYGDGRVFTLGDSVYNVSGCVRPAIRVKAEELVKEKQNLANCL